ncbi:MAG: hypothetical protein J6A54_05030 [Clostridia bacterium]|nr:hypothetical protein [Clostridia bacterium]
MRLNRAKQLFIVVTNESGRILSLNETAELILKGKGVGDDILDIIDADAIRKLSMYDSRIELQKSNVEDFPYAIIMAKERHGKKELELCFVGDAVKIDNSKEKIQRILSLYNRTRSDLIALADIASYLRLLLERINAKKSLEGIKISILDSIEKPIEMNVQDLELVFLTTISILNDISFKCEMIVIIDESRVTFKIKSEKALEGDGIIALCNEYPYLASKLYLIRSICEDEDIEMIFDNEGKEIGISYCLESKRTDSLPLGALTSCSDELLSELINVLL